MNFYILCGNAAFNKGDRGNLAAQIRLLREAFPHASITLDSYRPEVDRHWYPAQFVQRGLILSFAQMRALAKADVVVWGGGALIADNSCRVLVPMWLLIIAFVRFILRKPVMAWAHGVVLETRLGAWLAGWIYSWVDVISVRDANSRDALARLPRLAGRVHQTMDPAILAQASVAERGAAILAELGCVLRPRKRLIAISPTYWPLYHRKSDLLPLMLAHRLPHRARRDRGRIAQYNAALAALARRMAQECDADVLLLPRYPCAPWKDVEHLRGVRHASGCQARVHVFDRDEDAPADYLSIYRHCDLVVTTALHDAIFATALDRPCITLYYEQKGRDFFTALGAEHRMLDWQVLFEPDGVERVMGLVRSALHGGSVPSPQLLREKERLQREARRNVTLLQGLVGMVH